MSDTLRNPDSEHAGPDETPKPSPPPKPSFPHGPETVVNPEGRGLSLPGDAAPSASPSSSVLNRLFPSETDGAVPPVEVPAGLKLGHFEIEERIGSGGMGAVFRAVDKRLQRVVALKVLSPAQSREPSSVLRFQNEARAAARLDHDNIARVHYIGEDKNLHFIAFEYVTGTNVRELIQQRNRLEPAEAVNYTLQITSALRHTAAAGVVHRDIKPSNIIITPTGRAKLVDLGLARKESSDSLNDLTLAGTTLGTFDYISPEQAKDPRNVDIRSDIYSLGCTLYHMLTGEPPYPEGTVLQKLLSHQGNEPPDPAQKNPNVPEELSAIVRKMMASEPRRRYASPDALLRDLMYVAGQLGLRGVHPEGLVWTSNSEGSRFWERNLGWMATVAVLLLIVVFWDRFSGIGQPPPPIADTPNQQANGHSDNALVREQETPLPEGEPDETLAERERRLPGGTGLSDPSDVFAPLASEDSSDRLPPPYALKQPDDDEEGRPAEQLPPQVYEEIQKLLSEFPQLDGSLDFLDGELRFPSEAPGSQDPAMADRDEDAETGVSSPGEVGPVEAPRPSEIRTVEREPQQPTTTQTVPTEAPPKPESPIVILGADDATPAPFSTLEAACSAAEDGQIIELRYDGRLPGSVPEEPLRIVNKRITIRAARGYRPLIEFAAQETPAENVTRMITVTEGTVQLINVDLLMPVRDDIYTDLWAVFSLQQSDNVRLQGVTITVENLNLAPAAVVELDAGPGQNLLDMQMMNPGPAPNPLEFEISESLIRGNADLFVCKQTDPVRFAIEHSVLALDGSVLHVLGAIGESDEENARLELKLTHVTTLLSDSLISMESGGYPQQLLPVHVSARDNIVSTRAGAPLIGMSGDTSMQDFRRLLLWKGEQNFYEGFDVFWSITSTQATGDFRPLDFDGWRLAEDSVTDVGARTPALIWERSWTEIDFAKLTLDHVMLADGSPGTSDATDGSSDLGADLQKLKRLFPPGLSE